VPHWDAQQRVCSYAERVLLAFLAFVVLLAGFVAYSADSIARRAGRRHLRLFGLRPKTTALIVAVVAGMGISLASMLAFFALNRQAIRNIEQADLLRTELNGLKQDVQTVRSDLKGARAERDSANTRAEQARQKSLNATVQLSQAQQALRTARSATDLLKTQSATLKTQASDLKTQAQALQVRVSRLSSLRTDLEAQAQSNQRALGRSQTELASSRRELQQAQSRASSLDVRLLGVQNQISSLDRQNAEAQAQASQAQAKVNVLAAQIQDLDAARQTVTDQRDAAAQQRDAVTLQRDRVAGQLGLLKGQLDKAQSQATQASAQAVQATNQAVQATALARTAQAQLSSLTTQRDAVRKDLSDLKLKVAGLQAQSQALKNDNDTLRLSLSSSQANVRHLEDEYSRATTELSASRNAELIFAKNSVVYAGVVPSVRSLDSFLQQAGAAAVARGAKGTPAVKLAPASRQALEATLRGLNASTYVLCRASTNAAAGFAVELSCDAKPNTLLYAHGSVIRKATISLQGSEEALRGQLQELIGDAVLDLTRRGVPLENVLDGGLNTASLYSLLTRLAARGGSNAVVGVMPRGDVKPSSQVDLYADIVQ
jgi:predicted  nucleic acid-binding Zn-ribbon protein